MILEIDTSKLSPHDRKLLRLIFWSEMLKICDERMYKVNIDFADFKKHPNRGKWTYTYGADFVSRIRTLEELKRKCSIKYLDVGL